MLIHIDDVTRIDDVTYHYRFTVNGNQAFIKFFAEPTDAPQTGDKIIQNWLVKGGERWTKELDMISKVTEWECRHD